MDVKTICGNEFLRMVMTGAARLDSNRKEVNDLNVFPIPDGDTGDNMYMTIRSGCESAKSLEGASLSDVSGAVSKGMLLGARGNSGVILSRIFAGIAKGLVGVAEADLDAWQKAMESGVEESYHSVSNPVEGTILTVFKDAVRAAGQSGAADFPSWFDAMCTEMDASLERTPDLLQVLKDAGVVDSGGAGLVYIVNGMRDALNGNAMELEPSSAPAASSVDVSMFTEDSVLEFGYCTEFLLRLQSSKVDLSTFDESVILDYLNSVGESVVAFRDGSIVKVHVHTFTPGEILNHCQKYGEYLTVKIENMTLQHHENHMESKAPKGPRRHSAVIAVASGEGVSRTFSDMGATVIEGGQTMNPAAEDFIEAFDSVNAETIYVLPNNSNIILTAGQAASLYPGSDVRVIPSKTIGAGYAVLGSIDFADSPDSVMEQAAEVMAATVTGMVSKAIRDTKEARMGDYIGFQGDEILSASPSREDAAFELCGRLGASDSDVLLIFKGADVPDGEADSLVSRLQGEYRRCEVIPVDGGQPIFDYIIVLQ